MSFTADMREAVSDKKIVELASKEVGELSNRMVEELRAHPEKGTWEDGKLKLILHNYVNRFEKFKDWISGLLEEFDEKDILDLDWSRLSIEELSHILRETVHIANYNMIAFSITKRDIEKKLEEMKIR